LTTRSASGCELTPALRVIFLDIDGVLNTLGFLQGLPAPDFAKMIDARAVARLNRLIHRSRAKVVISSSWRCHLPVTEIDQILRAHGFEGDIVGVTPRLPPNRGGEIRAWIDSCPEVPSAIVILDDFEEMADLSPCLVRTSFEEGLLEEHVEAALHILAQDWRALIDEAVRERR
jgi:hypothetical protein